MRLMKSSWSRDGGGVWAADCILLFKAAPVRGEWPVKWLSGEVGWAFGNSVQRFLVGGDATENRPRARVAGGSLVQDTTGAVMQACRATANRRGV